MTDTLTVHDRLAAAAGEGPAAPKVFFLGDGLVASLARLAPTQGQYDLSMLLLDERSSDGAVMPDMVSARVGKTVTHFVVRDIKAANAERPTEAFEAVAEAVGAVEPATADQHSGDLVRRQHALNTPAVPGVRVEAIREMIAALNQPS